MSNLIKKSWKVSSAKPATQSDLSAAKSSHGTSKLSLSTVKDQLAKEKATSEARLKELEAEKSSHGTTKLNLSTTKDQLEAVQAKLNQLKLKKAKKSGKWVDVDYGRSLTSHLKKKVRNEICQNNILVFV